jgi:hypothetical protein
MVGSGRQGVNLEIDVIARVLLPDKPHPRNNL